MELYIVRHGQSMANAGIPMADAPLTELGHRQAELLGQELRDVPLDCIYGSTLCRAAQTAGDIAKRQCRPIEVQIVPELVEAKTPQDFAGNERLLRGVYEHVRLDRLQMLPFESDADRAKHVLDTYVFRPAYEEGFDSEHTDHEGNVIRAREKRILIASHGVFIAYLLSALVHFPFDENMVVGLNNTGVSRFQLYTCNGVRRVRFEAFNETRHLPKDALSG